MDCKSSGFVYDKEESPKHHLSAKGSKV